MLFRDSMNMLESLGHNTMAFNAVAEGTIVDDKYLPIMDDKVVHEECFRKNDRYVYFRKQDKIYRRLKEKVDISRFDIIHSHMLFSGGWVAYRLKKEASIPYVVTVRNTDVNEFLKFPFFVPVARKIADEASAVMFLSEPYEKQFLEKVYGRQPEEKQKEILKKCHIIPNGLESFWLENAGESKGISGDIVELICVGKIDHNKNMKSIVKAMDILKKRSVRAHLTVVGQIVDEDVYALLQDNADVEIVPYQTKEKLINYYRQSDIFVLPSFRETFGRVYAEAMTQGVPVVYTRNQGFDGFFKEGEVGYSVDANDPETVADAVCRIMENYSRISADCIEKSRMFNWSDIVVKLEQMYKESVSEANMKIALLSFHNAYNYGAALQAYGLQCAVRQLGFDCEYINYVNETRMHAYDMPHQIGKAIKDKKWVRAVKTLIGTPLIRKRGRCFERFYAKNLSKTEREYHSSWEAKELNSRYDRFVIGSDQVWNPANNGGDMAYLLDFVEDPRKKASYSSSFGIIEVPEEYNENYKTLLADFACLAVREGQGQKIVKQLTGRDAALVLDPVFLAGRSTWDSLRRKDEWEPRRKYLFFYTNRPSQVDDFLMTGYKMAGVERHILSTHLSPAEAVDPKTRVCVSISPERFLNEVAEAEHVITASFHCLAFAIIYHKKFNVLLTGNQGKDERMLSLLSILGLEDRIINTSTGPEDIDREIDYDAVEEKLEKYRAASLDYLEKALLNGSYDQPEKKEEGTGYFCEDKRCTGCSACVSSCPVGAIKMEIDEEGFEVPVRDAESCTDCGRCAEACHILNRKLPEPEGQRFYAAKNTDKVRELSSSGGVFTAVSDAVLDEGGVICAAVMDENYRVRHAFAENKQQRDRMRGTFYVQSSMGDCFGRIAEFLKQGRKVLFVGTPCQVNGLLHVTGRDENLTTCDIICHGVPSPLVFERFIQYLRSKGTLQEFRFRDKEYGYGGYTVSATIDGRKTGKKLWLNSFNNMFSHNMINRLSCSSCAYCNYDRPGDITIGDFWGLEKSHPELTDSKGVSLLVVNTEKGDRLIKDAAGLDLTEVKKEDTIQNSLRKASAASGYRHQAMKTILDGSYKKAARKYGENNIKGLAKEQIRRALMHK